MNNNELQQVKIESFTIGEELPKIEVLEALSIDELEQVVGGDAGVAPSDIPLPDEFLF